MAGDMFWTAFGEVQLLVLPSLLLGACAAKTIRFLRVGSIEAALGPTALFPLRLRKPTNIAVCLIECGLGIGLIATAGKLGAGDPAKLIRLGTGLLFIVATAAMIELRSVRPDSGCGCFGELSSTPVGPREVARSALLALAALESARLPVVTLPRTAGQVALVITLFTAEFALLAAISPEVREALVRLGYSEPCETRQVAPGDTLATLKRSGEWSRHSPLVASERPTDVWRELCWRYLAFPGAYSGRETEVVFAIHLESRRPAVYSVLVDSATGAVIPWPAAPARRSWLPRRSRDVVSAPRLALRGAERVTAETAEWLVSRIPSPNMPLSRVWARKP